MKLHELSPAEGSTKESKRIGRRPVSYTHLDVYKRQVPVPAGKEAISNAVAQACKIPQSPQRPFDR